MSGSLSASQMGALPGLKYATVGLADKKTPGHPVHWAKDIADRPTPAIPDRTNPREDQGVEPSKRVDTKTDEEVWRGAQYEGSTGKAYQDWAGGDTQASLRAGNFSTTSRSMSFAQQKGKVPLSASKGTLGSLLYAADEGLTNVPLPEAAGTMYQKER